MLKHKQGIFAAIAVTALIGYIAPPAAQFAQAQDSLGENIASDVLDSVFGGDGDEAQAADVEEQGDDNQNIDQAQTQEQEAEQEVDQENDQSETNIQANELSTGDNTATVAQSNDAAQEVEAEVEAEAEAAASASSDDDDNGDSDHHDKHKKHHSSDSDSSDTDTTVADADAIIDATATATGAIDQDNDATVTQSSEIHDVDLSNNVAFGDDENTQVAIPIIDQDQTADQRAANLDLDIDEEYGFTTGGGGGGGGDNDGVRQCFEDNQGFGPIRECIRGL
jgi:hypothetical protein